MMVHIDDVRTARCLALLGELIGLYDARNASTERSKEDVTKRAEFEKILTQQQNESEKLPAQQSLRNFEMADLVRISSALGPRPDNSSASTDVADSSRYSMRERTVKEMSHLKLVECPGTNPDSHSDHKIFNSAQASMLNRHGLEQEHCSSEWYRNKVFDLDA